MSNPVRKPRTNRHGITAPVKLQTVTNESTEAGLDQAVITEAEAILEALQIVKRHKKAFDLLR